MTTVNYPYPVMVNGYSCKNCTQVDEAKKHIDPAHPQDGPFGVLAKSQPPNPNDPHQKAAAGSAQPSSQTPAVTFGGSLAGLGVASVNGVAADGAVGADPGQAKPGRLLDIST